MARKRRAPSPPPPPPQEESSSEGSGSEELEETPRRPEQSSPPQAAANNADSSDSGSDSDSDSDVGAFQMRQVRHSPTKHTHPAPQPESDGEEDESGSSESEHENPVPVVQKKAAAAAGMSKTEQERKRPASDPAPTGKAKKAKAGEEKAVAGAEATSPAKAKKGKVELEKPAPEATPAEKAKKDKADPEKPAPDATPAEKAKKGKVEPEKPAPDATPAGKLKKSKADKTAPEAKPSGKGKMGGDKLEKPAALDPSISDSKSEKHVRWGQDDEMKILEALAAHFKREGELPKTDLLLASVRDRLVRKNCTYSDIYEKVRRLKERYEKAVSTGILPSKGDGLHMYNLSEAIWGEKAREAAADITSQKGGVTKGKKGQANKEKKDGNAKGDVAKEAAPSSTANHSADSQRASKKGQSRLSEEVTTTASPSKSKKQETRNEELDKDGGNLAKGKKGKTDKGKMDRNTDSLTETINANQNGGILIRSKEGEIHDDETEGDAIVQGVRRGFNELQKLYSNLAVYVEEIEAHHPCGVTLKRAFELIADEKAEGLESKIKKHRVKEAKVEVRQGDIKKEVLNLLLSLVD